MRPPFLLFGWAHLTAAVLAFLAPIALALAARRSASLERPIRLALAAFMAGGWLSWYLVFASRGWLSLGIALPLNLCDWAAAALILALLTRDQLAYELGYFWGLGGSLQGLITPAIAHGFPDPEFLFFFLNHAGNITALLYLTFTGMRPYPGSLPRVAAATIAYAVIAGAADYLLAVNYGFLAAKPGTSSILDLLWPWPWYIPEMVVIGLISLAIYYLPFLAADVRGTGKSRNKKT
ncbi:MAG TPA: TIGR02206 family membrane protein [Rhizomicrobium sp.]|nr:TIGR02206 family membrane protein [Rhizomicrobium sp.]